MTRFRSAVLVAVGASLLGSGTARPAAAADVPVTVAGPPRAISPDLFGVFFEDPNDAADGGLYPEFVQNAGDTYLPITLTGDDPASLAASCVRDGNDLILKWVSRADSPVHARLNLAAVGVADGAVAHCTVIAGEETAENAFGHPAAVLPVTSHFPVAADAAYDVPPHSLTVIRIATGPGKQP